MRTAPFALLLVICACGGDDTPAEPVELRLHEPAGTAELIPDGMVEMTWTLTGAGAELVITVIPLNEPAGTVIFDEDVALGDGSFTWDGLDVEGTPVPPDVYDLDVTAFVDGDPVDFALRNITVHGVVFTKPAPDQDLTVRGSDAPEDILAITVSQRVIQLEFTLDPDEAVDGDEVIVDQRNIPGEFVPFQRNIHFTGLDVFGAAVPQGDYRVRVEVDDADTSLHYTVDGGLLHWLPGE